MKYLIVEAGAQLPEEMNAFFKQAEAVSFSGKNFRKRFIIRSGNKFQVKPVREVSYFFADGKEVYLVSKADNRKYIIDYSLDDLQQVVDPDVFFRVNRKFLVCVDCIQEVKSLSNGTLELKLNQTCDHELFVSRDRANNFKTWLDR